MKVTPEQELALAARAQDAGVTIARLLLESALDEHRARVSAQDLTDLFALNGLVGAIGNNVNQLARVANSTREIPGETSAALDAVRRTCARLDDVIRTVAGR